jgi:LysR family glycine cleavage system transcriptional activator
MCRRLLQLNALRAFEVAARHKSLARAAGELAVTPAAIHHQVKLLEENLGVSLFIRSGNNLELTQAAIAVLPNLEGAFDLLSLVTEQLKQHAKQGVLSVGICPAFGQEWLIPRLSRFKNDFPQINLRISQIEQLPALANSEIDLAVFYSNADPSQDGVAIELLLKDEAYPVCSPDFQARHKLHREEDLDIRLVLQDNQLLHERQTGWSRWFTGDARPHFGDVLQLDTTVLAIEAAAAGNGVVLASHSLVQHEVSAGRLIRLFARSLPVPGGYYVAHLESVAEQPMVVAFREWLFAEVSVNRALFDRQLLEAQPCPPIPNGHKSAAQGAGRSSRRVVSLSRQIQT